MIRVLILIAALLPGLAFAQDLPARDNPYVNDTVNLLTAAGKTKLSLKLAGLHLRDGVEISLLTTTTRADHGYTGELEQFGKDVFDAWEIGATTGDDGILVMILWDEDLMRIELGDAFPPAMQPDLQSILDDVFIPAFVDGRPEDAILDGVDALIERFAYADLTAYEDDGMTGMDEDDMDEDDMAEDDMAEDAVDDAGMDDMAGMDDTAAPGERRRITGDNY